MKKDVFIVVGVSGVGKIMTTPEWRMSHGSRTASTFVTLEKGTCNTITKNVQ